MNKICPKCHLEQEFTNSQFKITSGKCKHLCKINTYQKNRCKNDVIYKLKQYMLSYIRSALKKNDSFKSTNSILQFMKYSIRKLKKQFEPWTNWTNHGKYNCELWIDNDQSTWARNINHIIPQAYLPYTSMKDENFRRVWALDNLRPYPTKQNVMDGKRKL